jgi:uncharacterized protein (TIGR02996 family)
MTDEEAFQAILDANPEDFHTRLVFADWLQERGDPRADGYRVLARLRLAPGEWPTSGHRTAQPQVWASVAVRWSWGGNITGEPYGDNLTDQWLGAACRAIGIKPAGTTFRGAGFPTRREAEDAAALGFRDLPDAHRVRLLKLAVRRSS